MAVDVRFKEYVRLITDTSKLSDRRQTTNDIFVGLNVFALTGMGVLFVSSHLHTWWLTGIYGVIAVLALTLNLTWLRLLRRYRELVNLRVRYLLGLEQSLRDAGIFAPIVVQVSDLKKGRRDDRKGNPPPVARQADAQTRQASGDTTRIEARGVYTLERDYLYRPGKRFGLSWRERTLVFVFMAAYVLIAAGTGVVTYLIMNHTLSGVAL